MNQRRALACLAVGLLACLQPGCRGRDAGTVRVASKAFTEGEILGDVIALEIADAGHATEHLRRLGGTLVCFEALLAGEIDIYGDYTGTLLESTFRELGLHTSAELAAELARHGLRMSKPLGFNNTYAIGMVEARARALGIDTISDLAGHPDLVLGFSPEFTQRPDAWPGLAARYGLAQSHVVTLQHELGYAALGRGDIDAMDLYSTDAKIATLGLRVLADDRGFFPSYEAVYVHRADLADKVPALATILAGLEGQISEDDAIAMNVKADLDKIPPAQVAAGFLAAKLGKTITVATESTGARITRNTLEHLFMVGVAMLLGILTSVPIGFLAYKLPSLGMPLLGLLGVFLTVPSLALLVFMMPILGIGLPPAVAALFLYSLLPMAWNTYAGLKAIPAELIESADALGLSPPARMVRVELPLAARSILAGIKISTVSTIGFAALGGFIGAGGYGEPIYHALQDNKPELALVGAIPAAVLALIALGLGELAERAVVPRGLRLARQRPS